MQLVYKTLSVIQLAVYFILFPSILRYTWPAKIQYAQAFYVTTLTMAHILGLLMGNLYFLPFYIFSERFEKYKTEQGQWPWKNQNWNTQLFNVLKGISLNYLLSVLFGIVNSFITKARTDMDSFPSLIEVAVQLVLQVVLDDFGFYWSHRLLHQPFLYKYHKEHHTFPVTISIAAEYANPVEYILGDLIPVFLGTLIMGSRMHLSTLAIWVCLKTFRAAMFHSGFKFPWSLMAIVPGGGDEEFHSFHHSQNRGNYATWLRIWDTLFGTDEEYRLAKQNKSYGLESKKKAK